MFDSRSLSQVKEQLSEVSPTFCAAKWLQSTIWLNSGATASCHLPPAHQVDPPAVKRDPRDLHNTKQKISARRLMLRGERPQECDLCWEAEDRGGLSERIVKSRAHSQSEYKILAQAPADWKVNPTHLEIAFGNRCNFACTYCNGEFSSRWQAELQTPYGSLATAGAESYLSAPMLAMDADPRWMQAFESWWPRLKKDLRLLRITGGEPLLSNDFWRFLENVTMTEPSFILAVNSNLGVPRVLIERLIKLARRCERFELYTSNEGAGQWAEYIRDGLDYDMWLENLELCRASGAFQRITVMATLGAISGWGLPEMVRDLRESTRGKRIELSFNLLRFPQFQSFAALTPGARQALADSYMSLLRSAGALEFSDIETGILERIAAQLMNTGDTPVDLQAKLARDLKSFVRQYDGRRNKSIARAAPPELKLFLLDDPPRGTTENIPGTELSPGP